MTHWRRRRRRGSERGDFRTDVPEKEVGEGGSEHLGQEPSLRSSRGGSTESGGPWGGEERRPASQVGGPS